MTIQQMYLAWKNCVGNGLLATIQKRVKNEVIKKNGTLRSNKMLLMHSNISIQLRKG